MNPGEKYTPRSISLLSPQSSGSWFLSFLLVCVSSRTNCNVNKGTALGIPFPSLCLPLNYSFYPKCPPPLSTVCCNSTNHLRSQPRPTSNKRLDKISHSNWNCSPVAFSDLIKALLTVCLVILVNCVLAYPFPLVPLVCELLESRDRIIVMVITPQHPV